MIYIETHDKEILMFKLIMSTKNIWDVSLNNT